MSEPSMRDVLRSTLDAALPVFMLIDPVIDEPLPQARCAMGSSAQDLARTRSRAWRRDVFGIDVDAATPLPPSRRPYVVALHGVDDPWLDLWIERACADVRAACQDGLRASATTTMPMGGCLQSHQSAEVLVQRLAELMRLSTDARTSARYLRLADARVLGLLSHVVGRTTLELHLATVPVARWLFVNALGELDALTAPSSRPFEDAAATSAGLRLTRAQWNDMSNGDVLHPAIARFLGQLLIDSHALETGAHSLPSRASEDLYRSALSAYRTVNQGDDAGTDAANSDADDRSAAVALSLLHGRWSARPGVADILRGKIEDDSRRSLSQLAPQIHAHLLDQARLGSE